MGARRPVAMGSSVPIAAISLKWAGVNAMFMPKS